MTRKKLLQQRANNEVERKLQAIENKMKRDLDKIKSYRFEFTDVTTLQDKFRKTI